MIPFRSFILPKIHASIGQQIVTESHEEDIIDQLFGDGSSAKEPEGLVHQYLKGPHTKISSDDFQKTDHEEMSAKLIPHYQFKNPEHENILTRYTGTHYNDPEKGNAGAFRFINARILGHNGIHVLHPGDEHKMATMDEALHVHRTPQDLTVFSGVSNKHGNTIATNDAVHHPAYLSTSLHPAMAMGFSSMAVDGRDGVGHLLKIHIPKGHPGAYVDHISRNPREKEFILPRDTTLRIDHSQRQHMELGYLHSKGTRHYIIHHAYPDTK